MARASACHAAPGAPGISRYRYMPTLRIAGVPRPEQPAIGHGEPDVSSVDKLICETRQEYAGRKTIAFLGEAGAGRTVAAALVRHTLSTRWVPRSRRRWEAQAVSGHDEINDMMRRMKRGSFPPDAVKGNCPSLRINMYHMKGMTSKIEMVMRDMPGKDYSDRLAACAPGSADELVWGLLEGGWSNLVHATQYVLVIDCEDMCGWDADKPGAVSTLGRICEIKKRIGCVDSGDRFAAPLAIVFTKADTLPARLAQGPADALARKYPDLMPSLRACHAGPLSCFKVGASTVKKDDAGAGAEGGGRGDEAAAHADCERAETGPAGSNRRLATPLAYSVREYERLITWLVTPGRGLP